MGSRKSSGKKKRLKKAANRAKSAPRWVDLKKFGMKRSLTRAVKRQKSRHWRRDDTDE
ncbi:MAG: 50S ribosomal protein L39e [Candidatus Nanohaloarchaeota archaeon QJJ-7]|nr:50S ribosomal protein L39e [Candidatus Nanohaloarchaeota archaeon QJJ-7]